jgi:hypothetical protein
MTGRFLRRMELRAAHSLARSTLLGLIAACGAGRGDPGCFDGSTRGEQAFLERFAVGFGMSKLWHGDHQRRNGR